MSQGILDITADFHAQELPNEIFAEREDLGHANTAVYQSEVVDDIMRHLNENGDAFFAEIGYDLENFDIFKYVDPELDFLLDEGVANILHTIDSGNEVQESNLNISVGTTTKSCHMVPVGDHQKQTENNIREMLSGPVQPLKTSEWQAEIEKQLQITNAQFQEELNHLKQVNLQLREELNRLKTPQHLTLQKIDLQQQLQVSSIQFFTISLTNVLK